jgi:hypothetical protein
MGAAREMFVKRFQLPLILGLLGLFGGCAAHRPTTPASVKLHTPGGIHGMVYLPNGQAVTAPMTMEILIYDPDLWLSNWKQSKVMTRQELKGITKWPAPFTMWIDELGLTLDGATKVSFDVLVSVRVAMPGQHGYVGKGQLYTRDDSRSGRVLEFYLVPEIE